MTLTEAKSMVHKGAVLRCRRRLPGYQWNDESFYGWIEDDVWTVVSKPRTHIREHALSFSVLKPDGSTADLYMLPHELYEFFEVLC